MKLILIIFLFALYGQTAFGMSAPFYDFENIKKVKNTRGADLNYDLRGSYDFNLDGVKDRVKCSTTHFIKILDQGKSKLKPIYDWAGPTKTRKARDGFTETRTLSGCEIVRIPGQARPMILLSTFWNTRYWRAGSVQWLIYHNGRRYVRKQIDIEGYGKYFGITRSIKCGDYPNQLVEQGYKPGLLCFFADYLQATTARSALLKLEYDASAKTVIAKDLTPTSGLIWAGGARGTNMYHFPVGAGWYANQRNGTYMMDSAFVDFNKDGAEDFITVGQHASIRGHILVPDTSRPEGVRYVTHTLTNAHRGVAPTEFLKVSPFNRYNSRIKLPCVYISSEREGAKDRDHIRCFEDGGFVTHHLPKNFDSEYYNAKIQMSPDSKNIFIKTRRQTNSGPIDLTFLLKPLDEEN